jgi:hypothetical protein
MIDALVAQRKETGNGKDSTVRVNGNMIFKGHKLTIGVDLGDHWSCYCVLDEAGKITLERKAAPSTVRHCSGRPENPASVAGWAVSTR